LNLKDIFSKIASLRFAHNDMSVKACDNCTMIMINYADLCLIHSHVASLLDGARLKLREIKARSTLLGACTTCPLFRSDLEASDVKIKDLKYKLDHSSCYTVYLLHVKRVPLSRVSLFMLPKRTSSFSKRLSI
jgi:hypothetical protein